MSVSALLSDARAYTGTLTTQAAAAMQSAISLAGAVGYSVPDVGEVFLPEPPTRSVDVTVPNLTNADLDLPAAPDDALLFQDIPPVALGTAPAFTAVAPTFVAPTAPAQLLSPTLLAPTVNTALDFPAPPAELLNPMLTAPTMVDRDEPVRPQTSLPTFDSVRPNDDSVAPTGLEESFSNAYTSAAPATMTLINGYVDDMLAKRNPEYAAQMARIELQLSTYLDGGTALNPIVEAAIYSRSRAKNDAEARRVRDTAYNEAAERGFTLPSGALMSSMQQARQAAADNNAKAATDIAIAQAEMEQKNLQFAVTTSTGLREAMLSASLSYMQNMVSINGQALDYAKSILNAIIETYNISLRAFNAKMEVYKADATVYETKLRGALAGIELYRAEVSALEALAQVDRSKVDVYRARIESLNSLASVYRAQIDAVQGRVGLERLKLDVFQSQVQAYAAQVQAKNAEWQGYTAAIEGETAKVRVFSTQADAYNAQVTGYKATIEAQTEAVRAMATTNDSRSRNYAAKWSSYQTVVQSLGEVARIKLENQRQEITAFQAQVSLAVANAQVSSEYYRALASTAIENARLKLSAQTQGAESQRAFGQTLAQLGTANAQIYASVANSALSGMNTLAAETLQEG